MENVKFEKVKQLQSEGKKLLVDFWAPWCGPCRVLIPKLESIEGEFPEVTFLKVNVDENRDDAINLNISSIPTVMIFNGENLVNRSNGIQPDSFYKEILKSL